jgi:hypothetical protein
MFRVDLDRRFPQCEDTPSAKEHSLRAHDQGRSPQNLRFQNHKCRWWLNRELMPVEPKLVIAPSAIVASGPRLALGRWPRPRGAGRQARFERRDPRRSLDRRRRDRAVYGSSRQEACCQGRTDRCGAATDAKDYRQSRRLAHRGFRPNPPSQPGRPFHFNELRGTP